MHNNPEEFENLRKLLKLKRHEQPPPGYFNRFSDLVINRIESQARDVADKPWFTRVFGLFESSPVAAGMFGAALCALVFFGISVANQPDDSPNIAFAPASPGNGTDAGKHDALALYKDNNNSHAEVFGRSTDPVFGSSLSGSPFGDTRSLAVSFSPVPQ